METTDTKDICVVCKKEVDWDNLVDEFEYLFDQCDMLGEDSLTENEQCLIHGHVCSEECFENLR
jgi:hypothetical protein